jgi:hypothetical protein
MAEDKFLAFKGLKQYDPDSGWASVSPTDSASEEFSDEHHDSYEHDQQMRNHDLGEDFYIDPHFEKDLNELSLDLSRDSDSGPYSRKNSQPGTGTTNKDRRQEDINLSDPLLSELFEQLNQPPQDELTQNWKIIATSVNILSQRMAQRRDLKERLNKLDLELESLRSNILHDLEDIQKAADQQLSMARLRAEVSTLAQARLASRLKQKNS